MSTDKGKSYSDEFKLHIVSLVEAGQKPGDINPQVNSCASRQSRSGVYLLKCAFFSSACGRQPKKMHGITLPKRKRFVAE